jgi:hypothetical protein
MIFLSGRFATLTHHVHASLHHFERHGWHRFPWPTLDPHHIHAEGAGATLWAKYKSTDSSC